MTRMSIFSKATVALTGVMVMALLSAGCSTLKSQESTPSPVSSVSASAAVDNTPVYYDFGDVMLPRDLKLEKNDSFVMNTGGMTSGVLVLRGNLDSTSLATFFENKMPVDGWRQIGAFRSARSIMMFEKKKRWCAIMITNGKFSTQVEIWVAPTIEAGTGVRK